VALCLVAAAVRLAVVLHPGFFYPDVRVHAIFAHQVARDGLAAFLREFIPNQFRHSLGLQMENGHWYAFPYPPVFYLLCGPLIRLAHVRPETAVSVVPVVLNSLEVLLVFALGRRIVAGRVAAALAAACAVPLLPVFLSRFTLALFPALVGHVVDTIVLLYLLSRLSDLDRARTILTLAGLLALAFLTYTQAVLSFGALLLLFLPGWRRYLGLVMAAGLGALVAFGLFYVRYVPMAVDLWHGRPMAEERLIPGSGAEASAVAEEEPNDPFAQPAFNPWRGVRKAASRLWIFYSAFAPLVVAGIILAWRRAEPDTARFVAAWAGVFLLFNLASGGLPGPNLVRHAKDIEVVAPLCCVGLGTAWMWTADRGRWGRVAASLLGLAFLTLGAWRAAHYLVERIWIQP
jgi:hypothetical protein